MNKKWVVVVFNSNDAEVIPNTKRLIERVHHLTLHKEKFLVYELGECIADCT